MSSNVIDFVDYQNRTALAELSSDYQELSQVLLVMYDLGLVQATRNDDGELLFHANHDATEEEWNEAQKQFSCIFGA